MQSSLYVQINSTQDKEFGCVKTLSTEYINRQQQKQHKTKNRHYMQRKRNAVGGCFLMIIHKNLIDNETGIDIS